MNLLIQEQIEKRVKRITKRIEKGKYLNDKEFGQALNSFKKSILNIPHTEGYIFFLEEIYRRIKVI